MYLKIIRESIQTVGFVYTIHKIISHVVNLLLEPWYRTKPLEKNTILFSSYPDYSDNARALYDYMISKGLEQKYELIWVANNKIGYSMMKNREMECVPQHAIFPHNGRHRFYYYGRRAEWYFHTHGHPFFDGGYPDQHLISLWHGGMSFKKGKGITTVEGQIKKKDEYILTSGSGEITEQFALAFHHCPRETLLPLGSPRNDLLFKEKAIPEFDSIAEKKILWMPTFRQSASEYISSASLDSETGFPILYTPEMVNELNEFLEEKKIHLCIKLHPLQLRDKIMDVDLSNIHLMTNDDLENMNVQLYEIINHFDALLTDYSSVSFDYLYLDRPIGYTLDDLEEYRNTRGFPMENPLDYMPGHHIYTYDDLVRFIADISTEKDEYASERDRVRKEVGMPEGGKCCQQLLEFLGII